MITFDATSKTVAKEPNPRDMEPTEVKLYQYLLYQFCNIICISYNLPIRSVTRIRGGGDDEKYNDIPSLTSSRFMWDGLPCIDFQEKVMYPLNNGLGSVYVKGTNQTGATLLQTVRQTDPGGVLGTPARAAAPQAIIDDSNARNNKAFHSILNYISKSSETYLMIVREYAAVRASCYL